MINGGQNQIKFVSTFEEAFPNYSGPRKIFGLLKKKQKGGFGKIMSKFSTKHVDLNLTTGVFLYMDKTGTKSNSIPFREIEDIFVKYINEDPDCPKEFPYSFSFKSKKRDYTFSCKTKEERDQWLQSFDQLIEFRKILHEQAKYKFTNQPGLKDVQNQQISTVQALQNDLDQQQKKVEQALQYNQLSQIQVQQSQYQQMKEDIEKKKMMIQREQMKIKQKQEELEKNISQNKQRIQSRGASKDKQRKSYDYDEETDSGAEQEHEMLVNKVSSSNEKSEEEKKQHAISTRHKMQQEEENKKQLQAKNISQKLNEEQSFDLRAGLRGSSQTKQPQPQVQQQQPRQIDHKPTTQNTQLQQINQPSIKQMQTPQKQQQLKLDASFQQQQQQQSKDSNHVIRSSSKDQSSSSKAPPQQQQQQQQQPFQKKTDQIVQLMPKRQTVTSGSQPTSTSNKKSSKKKMLFEIEGDPDNISDEAVEETHEEVKVEKAQNINQNDFFAQYEQSRKNLRQNGFLSKPTEEEIKNNEIQRIIEVKQSVSNDFNQILQKQRDNNFLDRLEQQNKSKWTTPIIQKEKIKLSDKSQINQSKGEISFTSKPVEDQKAWIVEERKENTNQQFFNQQQHLFDKPTQNYFVAKNQQPVPQQKKKNDAYEWDDDVEEIGNGGGGIEEDEEAVVESNKARHKAKGKVIKSQKQQQPPPRGIINNDSFEEVWD